MRSLLESFRLFPGRQESAGDVRARAGASARRIAAALLAAELAGVELAEIACALERIKLSGNSKRIAGAEAQLVSAKAYHLRECASAAIEMQKGLADALGDWVLSDCSAGTGLSSQELRVLLDVSGGRQ